MTDETAPYHPPVKRSVTVAGHETSITLEPVFWSALQSVADAAGLPLNALIARIDAERIAVARPPNLASALRSWLFRKSVERLHTQQPDVSGDASDA